MSADGVLWLPGYFRRLLHAVPDAADYTDFRGTILFWSACLRPRHVADEAAPCPIHRLVCRCDLCGQCDARITLVRIDRGR